MQRIYKLHACLQARNCEGRRGDQAFLEKFFPRQEKLFGHSLKNLAFLRKLLALTGVPSWLRACLFGLKPALINASEN